ncbi:MAG: hypothetical protein R2712_13395 [Vicinamibacterales bacterium]
MPDAGHWCATRSWRSRRSYGDPKSNPRRTRIEETEEIEYSAESFIVDEDNVVIVSRDGWVKRQKEVKDLGTTRLREGEDVVLAAVAGSTCATAVFFSNFGTAYTARIVDIPASTGYGEPVQKLFKFKDGERVIAAFSSIHGVRAATSATRRTPTTSRQGQRRKAGRRPRTRRTWRRCLTTHWP